MDLKETLNYLSKQMDGSVALFEKESLLVLKDCFTMVCQDIEILESSETPPEDFLNRDNTKNLELANRSLFILIGYFVARGITKETIRFIVSMTHLIFNWNQNVTKNNEIDLLTKLIIQHMTAVEHIQEVIGTLQKAVESYCDLKNWMPPAFDIAKICFDELVTNVELNKHVE